MAHEASRLSSQRLGHRRAAESSTVPAAPAQEPCTQSLGACESLPAEAGDSFLERPPLVLAAAPSSSSGAQSWPEWLRSLYKFSRPHTIYGTLTSICSLSALALRDSGAGPAAALWPRFLAAVASAGLAALLANVSVVGYNQLTDVRIDRVNKPYLPLASREWRLRTGRTVSSVTGVLALAVAAAARSPALFAAVAVAQLLGLAYSAPLPGLRWKRSPLLAATAIATVRGVAVQLGFFLHARMAGLGLGARVPPALCLAVGVFLVFAIVISLLKDVPDVAGDAGAGVRTAAVRLGPGPVFWGCLALLEGMHLLTAGAAASTGRIPAAAVQLAVGAWLARAAARVDVHDPPAVYDFYMKVWRCFYLQYILLPFLLS